MAYIVMAYSVMASIRSLMLYSYGLYDYGFDPQPHVVETWRTDVGIDGGTDRRHLSCRVVI